MRQSPRRPLILKRRKLPFQQNDLPAAKSQSQSDTPGPKEPPKPPASQRFPDGIRIMDHPSMSDTQVVVIPKTADLQSVIGALNAKGKECGAQGPNKFILLGGSGGNDGGSFCQPAAEEKDVSTRSAVVQPLKPSSVLNSPDAKPLTELKPLNKDLDCDPLDDSLTNIQWLGKMSTFEPDPAKQQAAGNRENQNTNPQTLQAPVTQTDPESTVKQPMSERPPYSYMAMIQFAINSRKSRMMTLKDIYTWIEDQFPYFREVAKPGWKNSIRHNLSLHDMFIRETSPDGKVSYWTIRPEANRYLTLDQVYKQQKRILPDARKTPTGSERRMKPLLPRTDSYLVPIQLPVASPLYLPSSSSQFSASGSQQKRNTPRGIKRVRIAPKVTQSDAPAVVPYPPKNQEIKAEMKEEPLSFPVKGDAPESPPRKQASSSRRKQRLVHSAHEEPVLLCPDNTFFDSGVVTDFSTVLERRDADPDEQPSPDREYSFKTPIKSSGHLKSSTPSKPPSNILPEPWKVTPVGKGSQSILDFSPIRTPGGPAVTPRHDYTTLSFNSTPFKDWPLFSSPRELLTSAPPRAADERLQSGCSRELLQAGGATPTNRSITEGLVLDTMNDSLSKILVDISFTGLDDEDLGAANISWSELIPQLK